MIKNLIDKIRREFKDGKPYEMILAEIENKYGLSPEGNVMTIIRADTIQLKEMEGRRA